MPAWLLFLVTAAESPFPPGTLGAELLSEVGAGQPVAVLPGNQGIVAVSADGQRSRVLVSGRAWWVHVDNRAQVIWFGQRGDFWLLDLASPGAKPELIARGCAAEPIVIFYEKGERLEMRENGYNSHYVLRMDRRRPTLEAELGVYDTIWDEDIHPIYANPKGRSRKASFAAGMGERVAALAARGKGRHALLQQPAAPPRISTIEASECQFGNAELCGEAHHLGSTRYLAVTVHHECGDACHWLEQLYDPTTKEFVDAAKPARRSKTPLEDDFAGLHDCFVAPNGEAFISEGALYRFDRGRVAGQFDPKQRYGEQGIMGGGWLVGEWFVF